MEAKIAIFKMDFPLYPANKTTLEYKIVSSYVILFGRLNTVSIESLYGRIFFTLASNCVCRICSCCYFNFRFLSLSQFRSFCQLFRAHGSLTGVNEPKGKMQHE